MSSPRGCISNSDGRLFLGLHLLGFCCFRFFRSLRMPRNCVVLRFSVLVFVLDRHLFLLVMLVFFFVNVLR